MNNNTKDSNLKDITGVQYNQALDFVSKLIECIDDVDSVLAFVAKHYDADRAYIFEFSDDMETLDNTFEWCKEGVEPQIDSLQCIPYESVALWVEEFERVGAFYISTLDQDVEMDSLTYEILEPQGIDSLITAPIYKDNNMIGFIGVDNPQINIEDIVILKVTASILYSEISRKISKKNQQIEEITKEHIKSNIELSEIREIIASANMGTWRIELVENEEPRMYVDETMKRLLGTDGQERSPEKTYDDWFSNVTSEAVDSVLASVSRMQEGVFDENTYLWNHPSKGVRYVRCGGTAKPIPGGFSLQGYHYDVDEVVRKDQEQMVRLQKALEEKSEYIRKTQTDEMTGLLNRRAYEEKIYVKNDIPQEEKFIYVSIDVNGLKIVNDTQGHTAGDELIIGVSMCMRQCLGPYGELFRIGGDEFVAILFLDKNEVKRVLEDFDQTVADWRGNIIDSISVSYGWISKCEMPDASVRQLSQIAEQRMYEDKSAYYRSKGVDRRGQQDAHKALCELYTKILAINITDDTYKIINMDENEQTVERGFADKISDWLISFGRSGQVHPDDLDEYLRLTDIHYLNEYFESGKTSLHIIYRRKFQDEFKRVMMEIIPANDYTPNNKSLFLYVKNIDV